MSAEALLERTDRDEFQRADLFFFDIRLPRMTGLIWRENYARGESNGRLSSSAPGPRHPKTN